MTSTHNLEIWAGLESTVNRVRDQWFDQCDRNGHCNRVEDIDLFASLGIKKLRYPVLWDKVQTKEGSYNFAWVEERLHRIWSHGIEPIATLLQHGSGPQDTSLVDPHFPEKLARYAKAVAEKFPRLKMYTPVNEPFTTARFSGLYGVWYPHGKSDKTMLRCLLHECKGTILAMKEIRQINPEAQFVLTEDMGRATGTEPCQSVVDFQNERRWISIDLLCGRIGLEHPLYHWILEHGVSAEELQWFVDSPCPPDVLGINHYLLSNRFLDHRTHLYPSCFHAGSADLKFADVGSTQVTELHPNQNWAPFISPKEIIEEVCSRYDILVAVTEVHIAGARESQMQWLDEVWRSACELKEKGQRICAITPWSLLGSFDWNTLCSMGGSYYEPGVFDIRAHTPRATALAKMIRDLAKEGETTHPVLENKGFWHRPVPQGRPILITGANGTLGRAFHRVATSRGLSVASSSHAEMDITNLYSVRAFLEKLRPWAVINTAGYVRVDEAEKEPEKAFLSNVVGSEILASECKRLGLPYMTFSSDLVFDGSKDLESALEVRPYQESDQTSPLGVYGQTKAEMERRVLGLHPGAMVVRTSSFFGPWDIHNFAYKVLDNLRRGVPINAASDVVMAPTYVPSLTHVCLDLLIDGMSGLLHLANRGSVSWSEFAREIASVFELDHQLIRPKHLDELGFTAPRPRYSVLGSEKMQIMPTFEEDLDRFRRDLRGEIGNLFDMKSVAG